MGVVRWVVRWYEADGDALVGQAELVDVELPALRRLVGAPPSDPPYDCWPVTPDRMPELAGIVGLPPDLERFAVFLEAEVRPSTASDHPRNLVPFRASTPLRA
jgi:hypothetical protein